MTAWRRHPVWCSFLRLGSRSGLPEFDLRFHRRPRPGRAPGLLDFVFISLLRKLGPQHFQPLDHRRRGEQVRGLRHESLGNWAVEMILPTCLILKRIKDGKRSWPETQREPQRSRRFLVGKLEALPQERSHLILLAWLCLQADKKTNREHFNLL